MFVLPAKAQDDFAYVFDYINYYETKSQDLGAVYSRFRTQFGSATVEVQQARMDSIISAADALWKDYIKSMPGYNGDNSYAEGYKTMIKYVRGDFKKQLMKRKSDLFQVPAGATEEDLTAEQSEVFNYYKALITEYTNKVEEYKLSKTVLENNFSDEVDAYVLGKILEVVEEFENGTILQNVSGPDSVLTTVVLFGKRGTYNQFGEYCYVYFDFANSKDKQQVYADYQYLADKMSKGGDDYRYYQNSYMYGGQDAFVSTADNTCEGNLNSWCDEPWVAHLNFYEGLYTGIPGCELKIRFNLERPGDEQD